MSGDGDQVLSIVRAETGGGGVRQGFWKMDVLAVTLDLGADLKSEQESMGHTQRWERVFQAVGTGRQEAWHPERRRSLEEQFQ